MDVPAVDALFRLNLLQAATIEKTAPESPANCRRLDQGSTSLAASCLPYERAEVCSAARRLPYRIPHLTEDQIINKLTQALLACGFLLIDCQSSGAQTEDSYLYCGKLLWPAEREDYLPFPEGIEIGYSSHPSLAQTVEKQEKHSLRFAYKDMAIAYRIMQEAVEVIIRQGANDICLVAGTLEVSDSGIPLEISPLPTADGYVIFESSPEKESWKQPFQIEQ